MERSERSKMGRLGRAAGKRFELKVRQDLGEKGFVVVKFSNQVDIENNKMIPAKSKYNPFLKRVMNEGSGFPDYVCWCPNSETPVFGVESKYGKYLNAEEKEKCEWLLKNKIFSFILIASPKRGSMYYERFKSKFN